MFIFHLNTKIVESIHTKPVLSAVEMLKRDMNHVFQPSLLPENKIVFQINEKLERESYMIRITQGVIEIIARDDLGFIYGLLFISERFLGIKPFWFWMDQKFEKVSQVTITEEEIVSPQYIVT